MCLLIIILLCHYMKPMFVGLRTYVHWGWEHMLFASWTLCSYLMQEAGGRIQVPSVRFQDSNVRIQVPGFKAAELQASGCKIQVPSSRFQVSGYRIQVSGLTFGRVCSRSTEFKRVWLCSRSVADFRFQVPSSRFQALPYLFASIPAISATSSNSPTMSLMMRVLTLLSV